jgi:hypothetical protein
MHRVDYGTRFQIRYYLLSAILFNLIWIFIGWKHVYFPTPLDCQPTTNIMLFSIDWWLIANGLLGLINLLALWTFIETNWIQRFPLIIIMFWLFLVLYLTSNLLGIMKIVSNDISLCEKSSKLFQAMFIAITIGFLIVYNGMICFFHDHNLIQNEMV